MEGGVYCPGMDVVALVREEWSSLGGVVFGAAGAVYGATSGEWLVALACFALCFACLRILQLEGWVGETA